MLVASLVGCTPSADTTTVAGGGSSGGRAVMDAGSIESDAGELAAVEDGGLEAGAAACVGTVGPGPDGARAVEDLALLARAVGAPEAGKLCAGVVYEATRPIALYRVWQRDRAYTERGRWWSLERPTNSREAYRRDNAICPEWSALDVLSRCELRAGARFVVGTGQSVRCQDRSLLAASAVRQVYVDNDGQRGVFFVERCEQLGAFPSAN